MRGSPADRCTSSQYLFYNTGQINIFPSGWFVSSSTTLGRPTSPGLVTSLSKTLLTPLAANSPIQNWIQIETLLFKTLQTLETKPDQIKNVSTFKRKHQSLSFALLTLPSLIVMSTSKFTITAQPRNWNYTDGVVHRGVFLPRRKIIDMIILLWQPPLPTPHKLSVLAVLCFYRRGENVATRCGRSSGSDEDIFTGRRALPPTQVKSSKVGL